MEFGCYMQCTEHIRQNMAQLSTRFMDHHERERRKYINVQIGVLLASRSINLFANVKHLAIEMPSRDAKNELVVNLQKQEKIEKAWSNLKEMKIYFQGEEELPINIDELKIRILELKNAADFQTAFLLWKKRSILERIDGKMAKFCKKG